MPAKATDPKTLKRAQEVLDHIKKEVPDCQRMRLEHPDPHTWKIHDCVNDRGDSIPIENNYYLLSGLLDTREVIFQPNHFVVAFGERAYASIDQLH